MTNLINTINENDGLGGFDDCTAVNLKDIKKGECLNHRHYDGMMERILKVFPNAIAVNIDGINCVACNKKV